MARIVKEHDVRLGELLDLSEHLFYKNGYENTSVQQIIDTAGIAKGTFYYYFDSKEDLLDQIVKRSVSAVFRENESVINDPHISAIGKLQRFFGKIGVPRAEQVESFFHHAQVLDRNLLMREKMYEDMERMAAPLLAAVIEQGVCSGEFTVGHPIAAAEMILHMSLFIKDYIAHLHLHPFDGEFPLNQVRMRIEAFVEGIERVLGMRPGVATIIDVEEMIGQFKQFERIVEEHSGKERASG